MEVKFGFEMVELEVPEWFFGGCIQEVTGLRGRIRLEKKNILEVINIF